MINDTTRQTEAVLAHHLQALIDGDLEAVLSDYSEESTLMVNEGCYHGLAEIRAVFDTQIKNSPSELIAAFKLVRQDVAGEVAYLLFNAEPFLPLSTDTFVVRDAKILAQTSFTPV